MIQARFNYQFKGRIKILSLNLIALFVLTFSDLKGQNLPPINNYTTEQHGGGNQNWSISQSENKFIYIANNKGLLEYNGAQWKLYESPNETIFRSVNVINDKIYTGFYMDFGFWSEETNGELKYTSLVKKLNIKVNEDEQFWNILEMDGYILFQSLNRIYLINTLNNDVSVIESEVKLTKMFKVENTIYFHKEGQGLYLIENGRAVLFSNHIAFQTSDIINVYKNESKLVVITNTKGIYLIDDRNKISLWNNTASSLQNKTVYNSIRLANGGYVLGTISNGALFLDNNGNLEYSIEQKDGLNNNTVLSLFEDIDRNVWMGLDDGINSVNITSNIKVYRNNQGTLGTIYTSIVSEGNLYLGSNQGLFYKKLDSKEDFRFIANTEGQVWNLRIIDNTLFCNHDSGIFVVKGGAISYIVDNQGSWDIKKIDNKRLISGTYYGLNILKQNKAGKWSVNNKISGFNNSSKHFELLGSNQIFVNHEYKGVFRIKTNDEFSNAISIEKDTVVKKGTHSSLVKYQNNLLYASKQGIYSFDTSSNSFVKNPYLSSIYSDSTFVSGKLVLDETYNRLWAFSSKHFHLITPGKLSKKSIIHDIPISQSLREGSLGYENVYPINEHENIVGTNNGYIIVDVNQNDDYPDNKVYINAVYSNALNSNKESFPRGETGSFAYKSNNFQFLFSTPQYNKALDTEYQYLLEGINDSWSDWSSTPTAIYENLIFGDYTFKVRSKSGDKLSINVASYTFQIQRPWYVSNPMIFAYVLLFFGILLLIHFINRRYYKKKGRKQLAEQQREFELQELEKEKQLVLLKNEQLKIDVESKTRELASSTMGMIKKNEFLNTIKNELKKVEANGITRVIKIIDRNLNNTDDWKLFEEAFNNADKGFIKKVKSIHPDLTPNDLRLCAYLRLNLPSKEIAPLLNISPRSVEVKRYRLRKKMNLNHKDNLTDYILNL